MSCFRPHIYPGEPLDAEDSFRLLELQAGQSDDSLAIRLLTCSIGNAQYEAVSYVWGDTSLTSEIHVLPSDGSSNSLQISVTANCYATLRSLRMKDRPRMLWVDAICINQTLVGERNHQLALMTRIYHGADSIIVYLGESADNSDTALDWIQDLDQPTDYSKYETFSRGSKLPSVDRPSVEALFRRPWFRRIWVLQEITLARKAVVVCGNRQVSWDSFRAFGHWNRNERWIKALPYSIEYAISDRSDYSNFITYTTRLFNFLQATRSCLATDPRDKLYAILPLLDWEHQRMILQLKDWPAHPRYNHCTKPDESLLCKTLPIRANYHRSVHEVYTELAVALLPDFGLDTLQLGANERLVANLPSWVTDWTAVPKSNFLFQRSFRTEIDRPFAGFKERPRYKWGSKELPPEVPRPWTVIEPDSINQQPLAQLRVRAVRVGAVAMIGDTCDIRNDIFPIAQWEGLGSSSRWWHEEPETPHNTPGVSYWFKSNGPPPLPPFLRTLAADSIKYPEVVRSAVKRIKHYTGEEVEHRKPGQPRNTPWRGMAVLVKQESTAKMPMRDIFQGAPSYVRQAHNIFEACDGRRFFITDTGYIGLAPDNAAVGDSAFVLESCSVPFILRDSVMPQLNKVNSSASTKGAKDSDSGCRSMILVGECWIYDMMEGQVWDKVADVTDHMYLEDIVLQ
ncbi:uncharacterized protein JN550_005825 [Neoarthrinium moseri]|uniref:uncharacterized protein n=1 Tax=Neoarthrinium moseri TaxID=1658444 RepID=UPI001FDC651A|nr:uncharacterized protein JN550_005825 [Neoarthrinium moseri]KAI1869195.1 hypothetical protein JN550_005825 [Neoarthrinium moseri]